MYSVKTKQTKITKKTFGWSKTLVAALVLSLGATSMTGCVTTEDKLFSARYDQDKAIETRVQIAIQYLQQGDTERAKKNLFWAKEINDQKPRIYEVLGLVYQTTGESDQAKEQFEKMLALDPNYSRGRNNYAAFLYQQKEYKAAMEQFKKVVKDVYYENLPNAYGNLGRSALKVGDYDLAEQSILRAINMEKNNKNVQYKLDLAGIYYQKGNYPRANDYFEQYRASVDKSSAKALLLGVRIAEKFNDKNAAASYALALRNLYPRSQELLEYLKDHE